MPSHFRNQITCFDLHTIPDILQFRVFARTHTERQHPHFSRGFWHKTHKKPVPRFSSLRHYLRVIGRKPTESQHPIFLGVSGIKHTESQYPVFRHRHMSPENAHMDMECRWDKQQHPPPAAAAEQATAATTAAATAAATTAATSTTHMCSWVCGICYYICCAAGCCRRLECGLPGCGHQVGEGGSHPTPLHACVIPLPHSVATLLYHIFTSIL